MSTPSVNSLNDRAVVVTFEGGFVDITRTTDGVMIDPHPRSLYIAHTIDGTSTVRFEGGFINIQTNDEGVVIVDVYTPDGQELIDSTWITEEDAA